MKEVFQILIFSDKFPHTPSYLTKGIDVLEFETYQIAESYIQNLPPGKYQIQKFYKKTA